MSAGSPFYMFYISLVRDQALMKASLETNEEVSMITFCKYFYIDCLNIPSWCQNLKINVFILLRNTLIPFQVSVTFYIVTNQLI